MGAWKFEVALEVPCARILDETFGRFVGHDVGLGNLVRVHLLGPRNHPISFRPACAILVTCAQLFQYGVILFHFNILSMFLRLLDTIPDQSKSI